jgi:hypothetical protein
LVHL